jgi:peroxiredoxin Q/BCP
VLYFYPRADTPGCTKEACAFQEALPQLGKIGVRGHRRVQGQDEADRKFRREIQSHFPAGLRPGSKTIDAYGAWQEKSMYGKKYMGIERSTVLVDKTGKIAKIWPKVKVEGHAAEVLKAVKELPK